MITVYPILRVTAMSNASVKVIYAHQTKKN